MESCKTLIAKEKIQVVHDCIISAEQAQLDFELGQQMATNNSRSSLIWDRINTMLINLFTDENVLHSKCKRGMWTLLLLYDSPNNLLMSFMREERFNTIYNEDDTERPQYIQALLRLNNDYRSKHEQQSMFGVEDSDVGIYIIDLLNSICDSFTNPVDQEIANHLLVVFSTEENQLASLKAYIINPHFDIAYEENWLDLVQPMAPEIIFEGSQEDSVRIKPKLTKKAVQRTHEKEMVSLKLKEKAENPSK